MTAYRRAHLLDVSVRHAESKQQNVWRLQLVAKYISQTMEEIDVLKASSTLLGKLVLLSSDLNVPLIAFLDSMGYVARRSGLADGRGTLIGLTDD